MFAVYFPNCQLPLLKLCGILKNNVKKQELKIAPILTNGGYLYPNKFGIRRHFRDKLTLSGVISLLCKSNIVRYA